MNLVLGKVDASATPLASWAPLYVLLAVYGVIVVALVAFGRSGNKSSGVATVFLRILNALERVTKIPGWAAAAIGTSLYGLLVAGQGFYSDVSWHVAYGRDNVLFNAPHSSIVMGLGFIFLGALMAVGMASLQGIDTRLRWGAVRIPWSALPLGALGIGSLLGFPLDELWHRTYGIDVTMWSPTHMLMILGASFSGVASWLILAEAGVRAKDSAWARGVHLVAAWLTLQGLVAPLGEFSFGVPQFQQIFHPVLLCLAAGFGLVAIRLVHGRIWGIGVVAVSLVLTGNVLSGKDADVVSTRSVGLLIGSAVMVELAALLVGTRNRLRFVIVSAAGIATGGLAVEWWWNQGAYQPWKAALLPDAAVLGFVAAAAAGVLATRFARAVGADDEPGAQSVIPTVAVVVAAVALAFVIVVPMSRGVGDVEAAVRITTTGNLIEAPGQAPYRMARIEATVSPADGADDNRWFQAAAWQGGGLALADMRAVGNGRFVSEEAIPVGGQWKSLLRLHRGGELMTIPIYLPADPAIGEPEVPAVDRQQRFEAETRYLLREQRDGTATLAYAVYALLFVVGLAWAGAFCVATSAITKRGRGPVAIDADEPVRVG